jgi:multidrug efflux pump subunit AcrB
LADITAAIGVIIDKYPLPVGMEYTSGWDIQQLDETTNDMTSAMVVGLILMLLVLIIQFNSLKYAVLIIFSILFSFGWIIVILALTWFDLTFPAMIAIFGVFGVGVNQMLILLEDVRYYYKEAWLSVAEAFQEGIRERFVPIFLTNATTIIGLSILALKDELFGSMAIAFIWWLFASIIIGLFLLPAFMNLFTKEYYENTDNENGASWVIE